MNHIDADFPRGWQVEPLPDGFERIIPPRRRGCIAVLLVPVLIWNSFVVSAFVCGLGLIRTDQGPFLLTNDAWISWVILSLLLVVGLAGLLFVCLLYLGQTEWRVGRNLLDVQTTVLGWTWTDSFSDCTLKVTHHRYTTYQKNVATDQMENMITDAWVLSAIPGNVIFSRGSLARKRGLIKSHGQLLHNSPTSTEATGLGEYLSTRTGWPFAKGSVYPDVSSDLTSPFA